MTWYDMIRMKMFIIPLPGILGYKESPGSRLTLLPMRGREGGKAPAVAALASLKTLAPMKKKKNLFFHPFHQRLWYFSLFSVEHHLSCDFPNILLLLETQVSNDISLNSFHIFNHFPHSRLQWRSLCSSHHQHVCCSPRPPNSSNFHFIFLKICLSTITIFLFHSPTALLTL